MGNNGQKNKQYLDSVSADKKDKILRNIANHYGISLAEVEQEVKDADAEMLYEYITNNALRIDVYNDFNTNKMADGGMIESKINELYKKSKFINDDFNWKLKLLEMIQDRSIEAYNIYQSLTKQQKEQVLQEQYEVDNDMGSDGDGKIKTTKENIRILLSDAKNGEKYAKGSTIEGNYVPKNYKGQLYDVFAIKNGKWEKLNDEVGGLTKKHAENIVNAINKGDGQNFTKGYSNGFMDKEGVRSFQKYALGGLTKGITHTYTIGGL